jgi:hypothetical protein
VRNSRPHGALNLPRVGPTAEQFRNSRHTVRKVAKLRIVPW